MKKIILISFMLISMFASYIHAFEKGHYVFATRWVYVGDTIELGWEPIDNIIIYEIKAYHAETEQLIDLGSTTSISTTYTFNKVGHYIFIIRSITLVDGETKTSDWSHTTQPENSRMNGEKQAWWVYAQIPPIEGLILE